MDAEKRCASQARIVSKVALVIWLAVALSHVDGAQAETPIAIELKVIATD